MDLFVNGQEISIKEIDAEKERLRGQHDQAFAEMEEKDREDLRKAAAFSRSIIADQDSGGSGE